MLLIPLRALGRAARGTRCPLNARPHDHLLASNQRNPSRDFGIDQADLRSVRNPEENTLIQVSLCEAVCGTIAEQLPRARKPSAWGMRGLATDYGAFPNHHSQGKPDVV